MVEDSSDIDDDENNIVPLTPALIVDEYDDELLEIFIEEGEELLNSSEQALYLLIENSSDSVALNRLLRDMHTLKGGARMAGVTEIGNLSHSFESKIEQFSKEGYSFSKQQIDLLLQVQDTLSSMMETLKSGQVIDNHSHLIEQLDYIDKQEDDSQNIETVTEESLVNNSQVESDILDEKETLSENTLIIVDDQTSSHENELIEQQASQVDETEQSTDIYEDELLEIFLEEAHELMESSEASLSILQETPNNTEQLKQLQRDFHTIKGGARMAGINPVGDLAHDFETRLEQFSNQDKIPDSHFFDEMLEAHDTLNSMFDMLDAGKALPVTTKMTDNEEKQATKDDSVAKVDLEEQPVILDFPEEDQKNTVEHQPVEKTLSEANEPNIQVVKSDSPEALPPEELLSEQIETPKQNINNLVAQQVNKNERIRVNASVLDELVNYAGEVSIYRSRLDQGSNEVQNFLQEMSSTIIRMREQLRRFEMETEAQIQSRIDQAESMGYTRYEEFDPLEFDRFSNMQQITRAMAESIIDLDSIENSMTNLNSESDTLLIQQGRVNTELQEGLMKTRMVPFKSQLTRFRRLIRQTSNELKKEVNFELMGGDQEIDRRILEKVTAPLEHLLRNAVAHGIESPEDRKKAGKNLQGNIQLVVDREGSEIAIRVVDDGAGINLDVVKNKAIEKGLTTSNATLSDKDIMQFILESGFTTASGISQISGRGVGMDVVNTEIKQLNGTLEIESQFSHGSEFKILMPLTMSVSRALMVEVGEEIFAIPLVGIENIIRESSDVLEQLINNENSYYQWHDEQYQFLHLGSVLGLTSTALATTKIKSPILLARSGEKRVAIFVDDLLGSREIVVKSVGPQLSAIKGVTGATILGDGKISLILDLAVLAREVAKLKSTHDMGIDTAKIKDTVMPTVMVVDDSITVRKVTQRLLKRHDYNVITARDGVDAIALLHETIPDVMLLDIEMPRMDGFELATHMRDDDEFKEIPIIMITSRTGDKHKDRAMKIGVNDYMGKPFQEHDLINNIKKMLKQ